MNGTVDKYIWIADLGSTVRVELRDQHDHPPRTPGLECLDRLRSRRHHGTQHRRNGHLVCASRCCYVREAEAILRTVSGTRTCRTLARALHLMSGGRHLLGVNTLLMPMSLLIASGAEWTKSTIWAFAQGASGISGSTQGATNT